MLRRSLVSYSRSDLAKPQIKKHRLDSHPHVAACLWHAIHGLPPNTLRTKAKRTNDCQNVGGMPEACSYVTAIFLLLPHIHMQTKKSSGEALYVSPEDLRIMPPLSIVYFTAIFCTLLPWRTM